MALGKESFNIFAKSVNIDTIDTNLDLWDLKKPYVFPPQPSQMFLTSSNAADVQQLVRVWGLDGNGNWVLDETTVLTGQNPVAIGTDKFSRINRIQIRGAVSAQGTVYCTRAGVTYTAGVPDDLDFVVAVALPLFQQSRSSIFTCPMDKDSFLSVMFFNILPKITQDVAAIINVFTRQVLLPSFLGNFVLQGDAGLLTKASSFVRFDLVPGFEIKCNGFLDIKMVVESVTNNDTEISCGYSFLFQPKA